MKRILKTFEYDFSGKSGRKSLDEQVEDFKSRQLTDNGIILEVVSTSSPMESDRSTGPHGSGA